MTENKASDRYIWLSGEVIPLMDAKINVLSPSFQYGLSVFEGISCRWDKDKDILFAFRLGDHLQRLKRSQKLIGMEDKYSVLELERAFREAVAANGYREDIMVRQTLFIDGIGSWSSTSPIGMFVSPIPKNETSSEYNKDGLNLCVSSYKRISDLNLPPRIKCGANYMNSRLAQLEAKGNGYDSAIFLNEHGTAAEGTGSCLFIVRDGVLITPLLTDSVLESITRDTVIKLASALEIPFLERSVERTELYICDEAFLCGSSMGITPVFSVDRREIGGGIEGEITKRLRGEYSNVTLGRLPGFTHWVTPVY